MYSLLFEKELQDAITARRPRMAAGQLRILRDVCQRIPPRPWDPKTTPRRLLSYFKDERLLTLYGLEAIHSGASIPQASAWCWRELMILGFAGRFPDGRGGRFPFPCELRYERDLRQPPAISEELRGRFGGSAGHPVRYVREKGQDKLGGSGRDRNRWEGSTQVDARAVWYSGLREKHQRLYVEAKFLSDVSVHTTYNVARNQIVRMIEAGLWDATVALNGKDLPDPEAISPDSIDHAWFLLLTPRIFQRELPEARLYGHLMREYRSSPEALQRDLPHLDLPEDAWRRLTERIGWATWEDIRRIVEKQQAEHSGPHSCQLEPGVFTAWQSFWDERDVRPVADLRRLMVLETGGGGSPIDYRDLDELRARLRCSGVRRLWLAEVDRLTDGKRFVGESFRLEELSADHIAWVDERDGRYLSR